MKTTWKPFCTSWTIAWNSQHTEGVKLHNNEWEESVYDDMHCVKKLRRNVGIDTWLWRRSRTSQTPHPPYATDRCKEVRILLCCRKSLSSWTVIPKRKARKAR